MNFARRRVRRAGADHVHPDVLEQLVGRARVAAVAQQVAVDAALVPRIQRVERRGVAGGVAEHQVFVAVGVAGGVGERAGAGIAREYASGPHAWRQPASCDRQRAADPARSGGHAGKRVRRARDDGRRQDAHRDQVLAAIVVDRDRLVRRRALALEAHHLRRRFLAAAVAGAELRHRRRRRHRHHRRRWRRCASVIAGRSALCARAAVLCRVLAASAACRSAASRGALRWQPCRAGPSTRSARLFAEHRDADHADVFRPAGARRVGVGQLGEVERGGARQALAPAVDVGAFVRGEHVARLRGRRGVAGDRR